MKLPWKIASFGYQVICATLGIDETLFIVECHEQIITGGGSAVIKYMLTAFSYIQKGTSQNPLDHHLNTIDIDKIAISQLQKAT